jgi:hypothetical protein
MTSLEITILRILEGHLGKDNAVSRADLVDRVNQHWPLFPVHDRQIRKTIKHLREQHGEWIGSKGRGYFKAETPDEVKAISGYHRKRGLSELYSAAKIERSSLPKLLGQLSIEFKDAETSSA